MKREYGTGSINRRGKQSWRIRYRSNGERFAETVRGTRSKAEKVLQARLNGVVVDEELTILESAQIMKKIIVLLKSRKILTIVL